MVSRVRRRMKSLCPPTPTPFGQDRRKSALETREQTKFQRPLIPQDSEETFDTHSPDILGPFICSDAVSNALQRAEGYRILTLLPTHFTTETCSGTPFRRLCQQTV